MRAEFKSVICASCGACPSETLCKSCESATLRANGLPDTLDISGLKRISRNHSNGFQFSELYKKLQELSEQ